MTLNSLSSSHKFILKGFHCTWKFVKIWQKEIKMVKVRDQSAQRIWLKWTKIEATEARKNIMKVMDKNEHKIVFNPIINCKFHWNINWFVLTPSKGVNKREIPNINHILHREQTSTSMERSSKLGTNWRIFFPFNLETCTANKLDPVAISKRFKRRRLNWSNSNSIYKTPYIVEVLVAVVSGSHWEQWWKKTRRRKKKIRLCENEEKESRDAWGLEMEPWCWRRSAAWQDKLKAILILILPAATAREINVILFSPTLLTFFL